MSRVSEDSPVPRHRAAPVRPGAEGAVAPSLAWKVCAVLPLVLLVVLMSVKVADGFGKDDSKESSQSQEPGAIPSDPSMPSPSETASQSEAEKQREILSGAPDPTELPDNVIATDDPSVIPADSGFTMPPGPIDQTATPAPGPTKKPTKKPTPSPTPTPEEAREACEDAGVSILDVAALAACIADMLDP